MTLLEQLGRQSVRIGSGSDCEVRLEGARVPELAAVVIHQGHGRLTFVAEAPDVSSVDGVPLASGATAPFDFRSEFLVGQTALPLLHPEFCMMVMARGYLRPDDELLTLGRDPGRCHIVLSSPGVSGAHATISLAGRTVTDHSSTSGTWLDGLRLESETPVLLDEQAVVVLGPLPMPMSMAIALHQALLQVRYRAPQARITQSLRLAEATHARANGSSTKAQHRTLLGTIKMVAAAEHSIGRTSDNQIVLDYPQISSHHAKLLCLGAQIFLEDSGSECGTYVRGSRLRAGQRAKVDDGEQLRFGPLPAVLRIDGSSVAILVEDEEGWAGRPLFEIEARGVTVVVPDREHNGAHKTLLDDISFKALPGDLIALMGPSGSGKTTLLHALTGYVSPTGGQVLVNGQPLVQIFDALRGSIGYVPQDDIVHPELTVREAVRYSARFRLPSDFSEQEIDSRVELTLRQLGLEGLSHLQIGRPEQKVLSGGQRKRVNIAMELVTEPVLLFLDEPTSGLAADDTTALVDLLARLAREGGKTIIATIHQPAKDEYQRFNLALLLGHGGVQLYFGPTTDAYGFFEQWRSPAERHGIESPRDMFAELAEREARFKQAMPSASRAEVRTAVSQAYRADYTHGAIRAAMFSGARAPGAISSASASLPRRERPRGQLRLLLSRYVRIKSRDRVGTAILMLQAPLIGVLLALVFGLQKPSVPYWCLGALEELSQRSSRTSESANHLFSSMKSTSDHAGALFFLVVAAVWFGTSNAAREVVCERAIFRRERMVNLGALNYVLSKFLVLSALCVLQCSMLLSIVFWALPLAGGLPAFFSSLGVMTLTAISSVALGLVLSTVVTSSEAAMALTPIALIPQVVLGGLMVPVTTNPWLTWPMKFIAARWGFEGLARNERAAVSDAAAWKIPVSDAAESPPDFLFGSAFHCADAQLRSVELTGAWGFGSKSHPQWAVAAVLLAMSLGLFGIVVTLLSRRR